MKYGRGKIARFISVASLLFLLISCLLLIKSFYFGKSVNIDESFLRKVAERNDQVKKGEIRLPSDIHKDIQKAFDIKQYNQQESAKRILSEKESIKKEHFHNLDDTLDMSKENPTLCSICHGSYPHNKNKESRALYNMHTFFCACEVCHIRGDKISEKWFDNDTGKVVSKISTRVPEGGIYDGNYNTKIVPCVLKQGVFERLDKPVSEKYVQDFMKMWMGLTPDEQAKLKVGFHAGLTEKPVACTECHRKDRPFLNFKDLGYPKYLCDEFTGTEVAGMVAKYKSLKLPTMFRPEEIARSKAKRNNF